MDETHRHDSPVEAKPRNLQVDDDPQKQITKPSKSQGRKEHSNPSVVEVVKTDVLGHLSTHEREIIERQLSTPEVEVSYSTLYRYATKADIAIVLTSGICAIAGGAIMPLMTIVFGRFSGTFQNFFAGDIPISEFHHQLRQLTLYFVYLGIAEFITLYVATIGFMYTGEHVTQKLRERYLAAVLRQNLAFFDNIGPGEITATITANMDLVLRGLSEKVGLALSAAATFVTALIVGFVKNWRLAIVLLSVVFAVLAIMGVFGFFMVTFMKRSLDAYSTGGTLAEEAISSIRTATALNGQDELARKYEKSLVNTMRWGFRMKASISCMIASMMLVMYSEYGLGFWQGSRLLVAGHSTLSNTLTVLLALLIGAASVGHIAPHAGAFPAAVAAAGNIFKIIDRESADDTSSDALIPQKIEGTLEFRKIKHIYPSRPEVTVLQDVDLFIPSGKVTALVGTSGSGKSTIVGLLERFYTPVGGQILLDGYDIQSVDLKWLRRQMSLVSQEPVLFNCSIRSNIEHGLIGTEFEHVGKEKISELVVEAAKLANAHDFICRLPNGYETNAGDHGILLSGGQKQRIAIARAVISDPKILLLDEATSALDSKSEGVVQAALDVAAQRRTTIVIAHRLSTIKGADNIVVLSEGRIVEQGTHAELLPRKGAYYNLIEAQHIKASNEGSNATDVLADNGARYGKEVIEDNLDQIPAKGPFNNQRDSQSTFVLSTKSQNTPAKTRRYSLWTIITSIAALNKQETGIMLLGLFFSVLAGGGMPVLGVIFAKCIVAFSLPPTQYVKLRHDINFWSLMYLTVSIAMFLVAAAHGTAFAYCSERLVYRARARTFRSILRQEISYFDDDRHSTGVLTSALSKGANDLAGLSGATLGALFNLITTIVAAIIISCVIGWKLGLVCTSTIPVLLLCGFSRLWVLSRFENRSAIAYESSATLACEAVSAVSTIASLTREDDVWEMYHGILETQLTTSLRSILRTSLLYAFSQSFGFLCMALGFWYGGSLIASGEYSLFQFFVCFACVIFSSQSAGALFAFAPDMAKSRQAAQEFKSLWDRKPDIDSWSADGERIKHLTGRLEFRDVHFSYPTRAENPVLQGLNIKVEPGQFIALVGASGCGKSTTIGLIERFYNPTSGSILVDGAEISSLNINEYRGHLALVMQEPVLFSGTIRENILLGVHTEDPDEEAVVEACKKANIHEFIISLPNGINTIVGSKGTMLSGGQKQRVAIARALISNPKILLLDEATSALDSESEKVVQEALDEAAKDRTTIAVAHRLSTVQRADQIYFLEQGMVLERGTHADLMKMNGRYAEMAKLQKLEA